MRTARKMIVQKNTCLGNTPRTLDKMGSFPRNSPQIGTMQSGVSLAGKLTTRDTG
jgi:hypothetical protein